MNIQVCEFKKIKYIICYPNNYINGQKYPVLLKLHGAKDNVVLPRESEIMVERVNACGGNAKLTVYPEKDHNAWSDTFSNPEVYKWMLGYKNENAKQVIDIYNDIKKYG